MFHSFDIDSLRVIVAGADYGSFARAAVQLGRSQSTISMQLKKLEGQAGTALFRKRGRQLVPTEAGEVLIAYARRLIALNDETIMAMGANINTATVRLGLPQDFFEGVMPAVLGAFCRQHPNVLVDIRVGNNHSLNEEISSGRLDGAIAFFEEGTSNSGKLLQTLPMRWVAHNAFHLDRDVTSIPLCMFDHPCLFRKAALAALDGEKKRWRLAVTTPSLPYIWSALRSGLGVGVRTAHSLPADIVCLGDDLDLPQLPDIELRLLRPSNACAAAGDLCAGLEQKVMSALGTPFSDEPESASNNS